MRATSGTSHQVLRGSARIVGMSALANDAGYHKSWPRSLHRKVSTSGVRCAGLVGATRADCQSVWPESVMPSTQPARSVTARDNRSPASTVPASVRTICNPPVTVHPMPYQTRSVPDQRRMRIV